MDVGGGEAPVAFSFAVDAAWRVRAVAVEDAADVLSFPLREPLLVTGACMAVAWRWTMEYLAAAVQSELALQVDVAPRDNGAATGLFPDTVDERAATGVQEIEMSFQTLLGYGPAALGGAAGTHRVDEGDEGTDEDEDPSSRAGGPAADQRTCHKCGFAGDGGGDRCDVCGTRWAVRPVRLGAPHRQGLTQPPPPPAAPFTCYLQQQSWPFRVLFPRLHADLTTQCEPPDLKRCIARATASVMWMGTGKTRSQLHKDRKDNAICQMMGQKTITIWPPAMEPSMYPRPDADGTHFQDRFSQVSLALTPAAVRQQFPQLLEAAGLQVTVRPGDVLFLPSDWWHQVDSEIDQATGLHLMHKIESVNPSTVAAAPVDSFVSLLGADTMGVPKFYRYMSERYPTLSRVVKSHEVPVFDNLYLDMNGIVHQCTHGTDSDMEMTEEEMFAAIFAYIEMLFRIIKPCKVFYM